MSTARPAHARPAHSRPALAAASRTITGKAVAGLRRQGRLPAVVYGHGISSTSVSVDTHDFEILRRTAGANGLVDLSVDGGRPATVVVHAVQVHRVTRKPLHVDLFVVSMSEEMAADVRLVPVGLSSAVELQGAMLLHALEHVRVRALPDHLPQSIEYSVAALINVDDAIHVSDLVIPDGVTILNEPGEVVAKILHGRAEEVADVAATPSVAPVTAEAEQTES